jgi:hypothetical protein
LYYYFNAAFSGSGSAVFYRLVAGNPTEEFSFFGWFDTQILLIPEKKLGGESLDLNGLLSE